MSHEELEALLLFTVEAYWEIYNRMGHMILEQGGVGMPVV
jgi:hypothetical protein